MSAVDTTKDTSILDSPYVGLNFYTQENAAIFFGRDSERTVLTSNLYASRLTLLYARSGVGKSSLLRAGVMANLTEMAQHSFDRRGTARNIPVVFSSWRDDPTAELIAEIQAAASRFLPADSPSIPSSDRLAETIRTASSATKAALLVILDQFEEYLIYRWRETREQPFTDELAACINMAGLQANFLISIREDAYFALGDLFKGKIGNVYGNYFHLKHLTREAAREAIEKPVSSFNSRHKNLAPVQIGPGLVDAVLDEIRPDQLAPDQDGADRLAGDKDATPRRTEVHAPYLQLVMKRLWDVEQANRSSELRLQTLKDLGGARTIVGTHVERALGNLSDDEREAAVAVFHHLVTPSGTKIALAASDLAEYTGRRLDETSALLQRLADSDTHILRAVPPPPGRTDESRFEVSHDLLAPAIQRWDRRHKAARLEQEKKELERQAQDERGRARRFRVVAFAAIFITFLTVAAAAAAVIFWNAKQAAVNRQHLAQSGGMAAEAMHLLSANGPLAMLLSLQAYETAATPEAQSALIQAVQQPLNGRLISSSRVTGVGFTPDGRTIAVGDGSGVRLWDAATKQRTATLAAGGPVTDIAFSPDGQIIAVGDSSGVSLWNMATRKEIVVLTEGNPVTNVAFSPDGKTLAVGDGSGSVGLWNITTGKRTTTLAEGSPVTSVTFSQDGRTIAVGDDGGGVSLWNTAARKKIVVLAEGASVASVAFSPDGKTLAVGDDGGAVGLWNTATRKKIVVLAEGASVASVAFSPDGKTLAVGDGGGAVGLWNTATEQRTATLAEGNPVTDIAFGPDGQTVAVGDDSGVGLWNIASEQRPSNFAEGSQAESISFSPDGKTLAVGDYAGDIGLWDTATGKRTATVAEGSPVTSVAFSPDGKILAVGDYAGDIGLWDTATGKRTTALAEGVSVASVAFSPDGKTLAVGDGGGSVGLWDITTGRKTTALAEGVSVASVAFSPDGKTLAVGDGSGSVGLWNITTGKRTTALAEGNLVTSVAFSRDGKTLAVGDYGGDIGLWDMTTGQRTTTLAEGSPVASVAFSPDGPTLVAGDSRGNVAIWDSVNGKKFANLPEGGAVTSLAFSADGHALAIGGINGNITLLWQNLANLSKSYFTQLICGRVQGNMTQAQWADYVPGQPYQKTCP